MMKFFRKYTKHLLAIFMSLLLVVWLGGSALTSMLRSEYSGAEAIVGRAFGKPVRFKDLQPAFYDAQILTTFYINWKYPWLFVLRDLGVNDQLIVLYASRIRSEPISEQEWYMLDAGAKNCGVYVPTEAIAEFKSSLGLPPKMIDTIRNRRQWSLEQIDRAMQSFIRIQELARQACNAVKVSEADIQHFVRQTKEQLRVTILAVESEKFVEPTYEPTEQELKDHFDKYKNVASRPSGGIEFGYELPEAVQVEYIRMSVEALAKHQKITDEEAYEHWKANRTEFTRPSTAPATSTSPATQPKPEAPKPYETFTEAKPAVIEKMQEEEAKQEVVRLARDLITQLSRPWTNSPKTQPGDYKTIPESERSADIYPKLTERYESNYSGVLKYARTRLEDRRTLSSNRELGRAMALAGTKQQVSVAQAAFYVAGLEADPAENKDHARYFRNLYETCAEPFVDAEGNAYILRTVAIRPRQAPESMDDLRQQLIEDVRKQRAYEQAERVAREIADRVGSGSLQEVFNNDAELKQKLGEESLHKPMPFTRKRLYSFGMGPQLHPGSVPQMGYDPELVETCFSLAAKTTTQPAPVTVYEQKQMERWLVIQYQETLPATQAEYDQQRPIALDYLRTERQMELLADWFRPEQIRARIGWVEPPARKSPDGQDAESPKATEEEQET